MNIALNLTITTMPHWGKKAAILVKGKREMLLNWLMEAASIQFGVLWLLHMHGDSIRDLILLSSKGYHNKNIWLL